MILRTWVFALRRNGVPPISHNERKGNADETVSSQAVRGAFNAPASLVENMGVNHRRRNVTVAK